MTTTTQKPRPRTYLNRARAAEAMIAEAVAAEREV